MDADDGESTQKMRGRCKTLWHHDRAAARLEPIRHTRKPRKLGRAASSGDTLISFPGVRSVSRRCPRHGRVSSHLLAKYSIEYEPLQLPKCLKESLCRRLPMSKVTHLVQVPSSGLRAELRVQLQRPQHAAHARCASCTQPRTEPPVYECPQALWAVGVDVWNM